MQPIVYNLTEPLHHSAGIRNRNIILGHFPNHRNQNEVNVNVDWLRFTATNLLGLDDQFTPGINNKQIPGCERPVCFKSDWPMRFALDCRPSLLFLLFNMIDWPIICPPPSSFWSLQFMFQFTNQKDELVRSAVISISKPHPCRSVLVVPT